MQAIQANIENPISIRPVTLEDVDTLQHIGRQTFAETFATDNDKNNMKQYMDAAFSRKQLMIELGNTNSRFYFAAEDVKIIDYLKVNFGAAQTELQDNHAMEIERIYVLQAYHGQGVGQLLYDTALAVAMQHTVDYLWLGVWERNHRAIRFYEKNGFVAFDKHIFTLGDDRQTDIMMRLELCSLHG